MHQWNAEFFGVYFTRRYAAMNDEQLIANVQEVRTFALYSPLAPAIVHPRDPARQDQHGCGSRCAEHDLHGMRPHLPAKRNHAHRLRHDEVSEIWGGVHAEEEEIEGPPRGVPCSVGGDYEMG